MPGLTCEPVSWLLKNKTICHYKMFNISCRSEGTRSVFIRAVKSVHEGETLHHRHSDQTFTCCRLCAVAPGGSRVHMGGSSVVLKGGTTWDLWKGPHWADCHSLHGEWYNTAGPNLRSWPGEIQEVMGWLTGWESRKYVFLLHKYRFS